LRFTLTCVVSQSRSDPTSSPTRGGQAFFSIPAEDLSDGSIPAPPQRVEITGTTQVNVNLNGTVLNAVVSQVYTTIADRFTQLAKDFRTSNNPDDQANAFDNAAGNLPPQPTPTP